MPQYENFPSYGGIYVYAYIHQKTTREYKIFLHYYYLYLAAAIEKKALVCYNKVLKMRRFSKEVRI